MATLSNTAPAPPQIRLSSAAGKWVIAATALGSGMIFLDGIVVNVALPRIQSDLSSPLSGLEWILNSYTLMLAALLLLGGSLGDIYGRKRAFLLGLAIFTLASIGCGLSPNLDALIACRALQGLGGALLVPGSLAMIKAVIAPEDSSRAIGLWAGLSGVTTAVGPLLGGYLVDAATWRAIFFINVPVALVTAYATFRHIPPNRDQRKDPLDWPAALLTIMGLGGLTFALIEGPSGGWTHWYVVGAIGIGVVGVVLFPLWEARAPYPMVPLSTFRSRNFSGANLATVGVYFSLSGVLFFLILDLQQVQGYSPLRAGLASLPITLLLLFLSPRVGGLMNRIGARPPMIVGPTIVAIGFLLLMMGGRHASYVIDVFPGIVLIGLGMSIFVTPLTATVMSSVDERLVGVASGVSNTITRIASLLAIAILGIIVIARFDAALTPRLKALAIPASAQSALIAQQDRLADDPIPAGLSASKKVAVRAAIDDSFTDGFRWAMATCALLCFLSSAISAAMIRDTKRRDTETE